MNDTPFGTLVESITATLRDRSPESMRFVADFMKELFEDAFGVTVHGVDVTSFPGIDYAVTLRVDGPEHNHYQVWGLAVADAIARDGGMEFTVLVRGEDALVA